MSSTCSLQSEYSCQTQFDLEEAPLSQTQQPSTEKRAYTIPGRSKQPIHVRIAKALFSTWNYVLTPFGLFVTLYGMNIVAWGGMAFLLMLNAAPAMCHPSCDAENSSRKQWIETASRVTVTLLASMAIMLSPWRIRDLYYLLVYQLKGKEEGLRRLAAVHRKWYRLPGSNCKAGQQLTEQHTMTTNSSLPIPSLAAPDYPESGAFAAPTKLWKLQFVVWLFITNVIFQATLAGIIWGYDRASRPDWAPALFVTLALGSAACAGLMCKIEGMRVVKIEGRTPCEKDALTLDQFRTWSRAKRKETWKPGYYVRRLEDESAYWGICRA